MKPGLVDGWKERRGGGGKYRKCTRCITFLLAKHTKKNQIKKKKLSLGKCLMSFFLFYSARSLSPVQCASMA